MKKNIYIWHRRLSIIIAVPVLLWAASGFMHPLMTNIKPAIATQNLPALPVDFSRVRVPLDSALRQNRLAHFHNFRLISIDTNWFYQVQLGDQGDPAPVYLSCTNGRKLPMGDWLYAQYLARQFLEGPVKAKPMEGEMDMSRGEDAADCCGAATTCVLHPGKGARVSNVSLMKQFDNEYKDINKLMPVYKVSFERPDGIRVYVETVQSRFAFAMDDRRAIFDTLFRLFHTWGWLDFLGKGRLVIEFLIALLAFCTALMGVYLFFSTKAKAARGNSLVKARRRHRYVSIVAALFTLLWTFSGGYHALAKLTGGKEKEAFAAYVFDTDSVRFEPEPLQAKIGAPVTNISLVRIDGAAFWQVTSVTSLSPAAKPVVRTDYVSVADLVLLKDGPLRYAASLAGGFSRRGPDAPADIREVKAFDDEYNFADKRLPVWRVAYRQEGSERYYVEAGTGRLAKRVSNGDLVEGYSFALFHKHHFLDWGGKTLRDISTMFWALVQVVMVLVGLTLFVVYSRRKSL